MMDHDYGQPPVPTITGDVVEMQPTKATDAFQTGYVNTHIATSQKRKVDEKAEVAKEKERDSPIVMELERWLAEIQQLFEWKELVVECPLQDYLQDTEYSPYEELEQLLAKYVSNWYTPDTSELKQYLQAISADERFELLKKQYGSGYTALHLAAQRGDTEMTRCLLEMVEPQERYKLLKIHHRWGETPLHLAAISGRTKVMRCMLELVELENQIQLLDIPNKSNMTALDVAKGEETVQLIRQYRERAEREIAVERKLRLLKAVERKLRLLKAAELHKLMSGHPPTEDALHWRQSNVNNNNPSAMSYCEKLWDMLADYVCNPWHTLDTSVLKQHLQAVSADLRFELLKENGTTTIHEAAERGHTRVITALLEMVEPQRRYELLKMQNRCGNPALTVAAERGDARAMRCMLEQVEPGSVYELLKIRIEFPFRYGFMYGMTAIEEAAWSGHTKVINAMLAMVEPENQLELLDIAYSRGRTAVDVAKGDRTIQIMRQCGESTAGKFRESPRRQRTATEVNCVLESPLHPTAQAFAVPCKDNANSSNEQFSTGDPHHGERSHKVPMVEKTIEPTQVIREETTQATQEERENTVSQQNTLGDNTPVSLIPSNVVFQSDQSSLSLSESVPRPASTYQEEPSSSAPNLHEFRSSKMPSKQPLARNHCLKSVDCKLPSIGANILQDTKCGSSANEKKYFAVTAAHSFLSENDVEWIFNPSRHGISSAIPSYNREIACYPIARYPDNQNPLLPLSLQKKLAEMSPREYLSAVLRELSLEERESLMIDEKHRRNTFLVNWPHDSNLSGVKMAQAGFYCVDDYDRVQCVFCRGSLHKWEAEDNPMTEHAKLFPFCRFVKGLECGNKEYKNDLLLADELKNITLLTMPEMKKNRDGSVSTNSGAFGISTNKAAVIKYAPYETRKNTYGRWPAANVIRPEPLCEAGFYYTGFDDQVRCFFCSGGLREWSSEDNPWEEHARWFPDCSYLLQHKGEIYVTEVHARTEDGKKCPRKTVLQKKTEKECKQKVSTQQAMYELIVVKLNHDRRAADITINRNGKTFDRAKEMVEAVYQVEEDGNMDSDRMETTSLVPDNLQWIFNPSLHGISSALPSLPSYFTDVLCYAGGGHYTDTHNPLPFDHLQELNEMSPQDYVDTVRNELTSEQLTWLMSMPPSRKKTFLDNWPHAGNLSGQKMAEAGFYYSGGYDSVRCVFCGVVINQWEARDNPITEHIKKCSSCWFLPRLRSEMECSTVQPTEDGTPEEETGN